jgi:hypothetical protein
MESLFLIIKMKSLGIFFNSKLCSSLYMLITNFKMLLFSLFKKGGPVTNNENINIDGSKILTSTAVWPLTNINIDDRK